MWKTIINSIRIEEKMKETNINSKFRQTKENFVSIVNRLFDTYKKSQELTQLGFDCESNIIENLDMATDTLCGLLCELYDIDIEFFVEWQFSDKKKVSKRSGKTRYILIDTPERFYDFAMANKPTLIEYGVI